MSRAKISRQEAARKERTGQIPTSPTYPATVDAVPVRDQGATLRLTANEDGGGAAAALVLELTLTAGELAIQREIEHRRTNVLPFLFAFTADGQVVSRESSGGIAAGGAKRFVELVPAKSRKTWTVRVASDSLASVLPAGAREVTIVAVFSERQHASYEKEGPSSLDEAWSRESLRSLPPQIVVRSNEIRLRKSGTRRTVSQEAP